MKIVNTAIASLLVLAFWPSQVFSQSTPASQGQAPVYAPVISDGTPVRLRLIRMVSSESDQPGEQVEFELLDNVIAGNAVALPAGSSVWGRVTASAPATTTSNRRGVLEIRLEGLRLANGQIVPLRNLKQLPTDASSNINPESLMDLVNSPSGPLSRFTRLPEVTIPKNTMITLYVAADVPVGAPPPKAHGLAAPLPDSASGTVADRIVGKGSNTVSLGDVARQQRDRGVIGTGLANKN